MMRACLIFVAVTSVATARAQTASPATHLRIGIVGGPSSTTFAGKDATKSFPDPRRESLGGVFFVVPLRGRFAIQPELLLSTRGAGTLRPGGPNVLVPIFGVAYEMTYVEAPVLVRVDLLQSGVLRPFFVAGPDVAWRTSCHVVVANFPAGNRRFRCDEVANVTGQREAIKAVDVAAAGGGGVAFNVLRATLTIGARFTHSFTTVNDRSDLKHQVVSGLATVEFPWRR